MRSKLLLSMSGLALGLAVSLAPAASAVTSFFPYSQCDSLCYDLYEACFEERGPNAGCGRELNNCYRFCRTGRL